MREDLFQELLESVREAGAYLRGEHVDGIRITFIGEPDPREVRAKLGARRSRRRCVSAWTT